MLIGNDKLAAMVWIGTIKRAKAGNPEAQETLRAENKARKELGQPTVEEELKKMLQDDSRVIWRKQGTAQDKEAAAKKYRAEVMQEFDKAGKQAD